MKRLIYLSVCALIAPVGGHADEETKELCRLSDTPFEERLAACTALIETPDYEYLAWAYERRGDAYYDADNYEPAIVEFTNAIDLDPENATAWGQRAYARMMLGQYEDALTDIRTRMELTPDEDWPVFVESRIFYEMQDYEQALVSADRAIEMDPDWFYSRRLRARIYRGLGEPELASIDYDAAIQLEPWFGGIHYEPGMMWWRADNHEAAAWYFGLLNVIRPNYPDGRMMRDITAETAGEIQLPATEYSPPENGLTVRYIMDYLPENTTDEMEEAIFALADFFAPRTLPEPQALAYFVRHHEVLEDGRVAINVRLENERDIEVMEDAVPDQVLSITDNALFRSELPAEEGAPRRMIVYDGQSPVDLWPLEVGNTVSGNSGFEIECPETPSIQTTLVGCLVDVETVQLGEMEFTATVLRAEEIHVPLGIFQTFHIQMTETRRMGAMGRSIEQHYVIDNWFAPELGIFVKRSVTRDQMVTTLYAVEIMEKS